MMTGIMLRTIRIDHHVDGHTFVWRYSPHELPALIVTPAILAAAGGRFSYDDAAAVTQAMRDERYRRESLKNASGV